MRTEDALLLLEKMIEENIEALPTVEPQVIDFGNDMGDEEQMVLLLSDIQVGHKTPTTTARIIGNRLERLADRVVKLATIHRNAYPIKILNIFMLGDNIQSEQIGHKVGLDELEMSTFRQMFDVAIPEVTKFLLTMQEHFGQVNCYCVPGNHGNLGKFHADSTNWDTVIYKAIEGQIANQPNIKMVIEEEHFWHKVKLFKWTFLLTHGESIRMWMNFPWYGTTKMAMRWQGSIPGNRFHYMCLGHFHIASMYDWNEVEIMVNGCFVSDDQWVLKKIGTSGSTVQIAFGVHPEQGVTWRYKVRLD